MAGSNPTRITELDAELLRLRRRAARQKRAIATRPDAWQRWSSTMEEVGRHIEQMFASPAPDVSSLAAKFYAILWQIETNESLLDRGDLRRLRRFGRDLRLVARGPEGGFSPRIQHSLAVLSVIPATSQLPLDCGGTASMCCGHRPATPGPCR